MAEEQKGNFKFQMLGEEFELKNWTYAPTFSNVITKGKRFYPYGRDVIDIWCYSTVTQSSALYGVGKGNAMPSNEKLELEKEARFKYISTLLIHMLNCYNWLLDKSIGDEILESDEAISLKN